MREQHRDQPGRARPGTTSIGVNVEAHDLNRIAYATSKRGTRPGGCGREESHSACRGDPPCKAARHPLLPGHRAGLADASVVPLRFQAHDFRRLFTTRSSPHAALSGLRPTTASRLPSSGSSSTSTSSYATSRSACAVGCSDRVPARTHTYQIPPPAGRPEADPTSHDPNVNVRRSIAGHPNLPPERLAELLHDLDDGIAERAARNSSLLPEAMRRLLDELDVSGLQGRPSH